MTKVLTHEKLAKSFATICVLITGFFCVITMLLLICHYAFNSGNHWFLFGTWIDKMLVKNKMLCAVILAMPMVIPLFVKVSRQNMIIAICGVIAFFIFYLSFNVFVD